ncbi:hypothetical protein [Yersinia enterocolitica]|uniref:hypothetical protein n=1 Tax=Yersinia enterocolitica TaxID=630 RepID=UPI003D063B9A
MKELDSFTVEQLNNFIESDHAQCGDVAALARIALAAKRAEPVAWEVNGILCHTKEEADSYVGEPAPLYDEPQLNSPVIPEGWNGTLETAAKLIDLCRTYTILGDTGSYKERTINDCELTMQEIESYLAAAPEKENG